MKHLNVYFFLILTLQNLHAQQQGLSRQLKFEHIGASQGFYSTTVDANVVQDKTGFLWVGTDEGLYRYDGNEFKFFTNEPLDKNSFPSTGVNCLYAGSDALIWVGSASGLCTYNQEKEKFSVFKSSEKQFAFLSTSSIISIAAGKENNLWVTADGKIVTINLLTHEVKLVMESAGLAYLFIDRAGNAWIGTDGSGLFCIDHKTKKSRVYHHDPIDKNSLSVDNIFNVTEDRNGNIWCATTEGVCRLDISTGKFTRFRHNDFKYNVDDDDSLSSNFINGGVYVDRHGTVWVGTYGGGLNRFVPEKESFIKYKSELNNPNSLGCDNISNIFEDNSGVLWVGTDGGGLYKCFLGKENYHTYRNVTQKSQADNIRDVYCDTRGTIWLAMYGEDTYNFDPATKKFRSWLTNNKRDSAIRYYMTPPTGYYDDGKNLYIIAVYEGLMRLNRETEKGTMIHSNYLIPEKVKDYTNYFTIVADSAGRLWMGGQRGITIYDTTTKQLKSFKEIFKDTNQLSNEYVYVQFINGYIWSLGTAGGLSKIDPRTGNVKVYKHHEGDSASLSHNSIERMAMDNKGFFWIAMDGGGLNVFDPEKEIFRTFTMKDGLPSNVINGLLIDNCNNVWLITTKGISRCSYHQDESPFTAKLTVRNFDFGEKAGSNSKGSVYCTKGKDGTFYFASQGGLLAFHPDSLKDNPFIPPVVLTDFLLFNKNISASDSSGFLKSSISYTKEITLSYQQNVIGFKFAALSYNHPEKNQYAYMLEGFDKDWIYTDASNRFANYTNLDAGEYTFKVKASNNDGVWNEKPTKLKLIISPPFWETWWFRIAVAAAVAGAGYSVYRYRLQQIIKLQTIRNNIASDLHDDIGSTLNSISVFSEVAKQQSEKNIPALDEIGKSSRKIIDAMSDIVWTINSENDTFEKIIVRMRSFAYNLLKAKKIELVFKADASLNTITLPMLVRKNIYLIFKEATNNLVKYSSATKAMYQISYSNKQIHLEIRDNGTGFNVAEATQGNGLKNMKRRAKEINAQINIESEVGNGTNVELILKT